jgi:hypothetical protein
LTLPGVSSDKGAPDEVFEASFLGGSGGPARAIIHQFDFLSIWIATWAGVRSVREACLHWSDAHGEKDSLPSGVAGALIRHEIPSAFVAQSLIGLSTRLRRDKIVDDNHCFTWRRG